MEYGAVHVVQGAVLAVHDSGARAVAGLVKQNSVQCLLIGRVDPGPRAALAGAGDGVTALGVEGCEQQHRGLRCGGARTGDVRHGLERLAHRQPVLDHACRGGHSEEHGQATVQQSRTTGLACGGPLGVTDEQHLCQLDRRGRLEPPPGVVAGRCSRPRLGVVLVDGSQRLEDVSARGQPIEVSRLADVVRAVEADEVR